MKNMMPPLPTQVPPHTIADNDQQSHVYSNYGVGDEALERLMLSHETQDTQIEFIETTVDDAQQSIREIFTDTRSFQKRINRAPPVGTPMIRAISVHKLSKDLLKFLGYHFHMEHDLWNSRRVACDREYFAAPLNEKGASRFFHFHLACVEFYRTTPGTPPEWRKSRKINHTTRVITLKNDISSQQTSSHNSVQVFVIRRITGHLRRDGNMWTFLYMCDPFEDFDKTHFVLDRQTGSGLSPTGLWLSDCFSNNTNTSYTTDLCADGFGIIAKILRDIKSSWKLLMTVFERFLEDANDTFSDTEFIDSANFFHREFLLNLDYFQRQLFYHERCVTYLTSTPSRQKASIVPTVFMQDFIQESNALKVVGLRLNALRLRTTTVLDMILSLNSIKQTKFQQQDNKIALAQGESVRKLTIINLIFLPPSFAATLFGMNTKQTQELQIWIFVITAIILSTVTLGFIMLRVVRTSPAKSLSSDSDGDDEVTKTTSNDGDKATHRRTEKHPDTVRNVLRWMRSFHVRGRHPPDPEVILTDEHSKI